MKKKNFFIFYSILILGAFMLTLSACKKDDVDEPDEPQGIVYGTVTDIDGNTYVTVEIGTQTWMAENLKVTKYRNGDPIPNVSDVNQWTTLSTGAYCNYDNNVSNVATYGRLYNMYAVEDPRGLAPQGWKVASDDDWYTLLSYLGGEEVAAPKMREVGTEHWAAPNTGATDEIGFKALPAGARSGTLGHFNGKGYTAYWWTSTLQT